MNDKNLLIAEVCLAVDMVDMNPIQDNMGCHSGSEVTGLGLTSPSVSSV